MTDVPFGLKLRIPFSFKDSNGNDALVDGTPTVTTTLGTVIEVVATDTGFSALIEPAGVGSFTVSGEADVDRGAGVKTLAFSLGDHLALASPEAASVVVGTASTE